MHPSFLFASFVLLVLAKIGAMTVAMTVAMTGPSQAGDWRSHYTNGTRSADGLPGRSFQSCCGDKDCRTAEALGFPKIKRRDDGGYDVRINGHLIKYDFPAVHVSEDKKTWICYLGSYGEGDPLCLFLPPGII